MPMLVIFITAFLCHQILLVRLDITFFDIIIIIMSSVHPFLVTLHLHTHIFLISAPLM